MSTSWVHRHINTGNLEIDGSPVEMRLEHRASVSPPEEREEVSANSTGEGGYYNRRVVSGLGMRSDMVMISKEIALALRAGHEVTAGTDEAGRAEFKKIGPLILGLSERRVPMSVGRLGLQGVLDLKQPETPIKPELDAYAGQS